jgi:RNA polymerase sigma-70 factor (ECF subfamily)
MNPAPRSKALDHALVDVRADLLRAAKRRLRNAAWAEDAVSEALVSAMQHPPGIDDPSRLRAWLFGVLRHKVVDQLRMHLGNLPLDDRGAAESSASSVALQGVAADPAQAAGDAQFIAALGVCLQQLPVAQARAVVLRDALGHDSQHICSELDVKPGHLWVLLHRGRSRLRQQLAAHRT